MGLPLAGRLAPGRLSAVAATILLAVAVVVVWATAFGSTGQYYFFDLYSYRDTLVGVINGDPMFTWLGYPPVTLIFLSPLHGLPDLAGNQLWTGVSLVVAIGVVAVLTERSMEQRGQPIARHRAGFVTRVGLAGTALLLSEPGLTQFINGQVTLFVLALAFVDASGFLPRRWQGSLVGIAAALKLTPLIFFPYYLITRQWRQLGTACASFGVFTGIGFALFPGDSLYFWTHTDSSGRLGPGGLENQSMFGLLNRWLDDPTLIRVLWVVLVLAVGFLAYWRARSHYRAGEQLQAVLVLGCASTAISPIAWPHYQLWLVLTAIWLALAGIRNGLWMGIGLYAVYSPTFSIAVAQAMGTGSVVARVAWELLVLCPVLVSALGLPHSSPPDPVAGSEPTGAPSNIESSGQRP